MACFLCSPTHKAKACYGLCFAPCCSPAQHATLVGSPHPPVCGFNQDPLYRVHFIRYHLQVDRIPVHSLTLSLSFPFWSFIIKKSLQPLFFKTVILQNYSIFSCLFFLSHSWVLHPTPSPTPTLSPSLKKMSVSLTTDIQLEGESGPLIEPCSRGKASPQPQGTKEGTGEGLEAEESSPQDAQVGKSVNFSMLVRRSGTVVHPYFITVISHCYLLF